MPDSSTIWGNPMASRARAQGSLARQTFRAAERVFPAQNNSPLFRDSLWDFRHMDLPASLLEFRIDFQRFPEGYRLACKEVLMILANPNHPKVVAAGVVRRGGPLAVVTLVNKATMMAVIAEWGTANDLEHLHDWNQTDADEFLAALRSGAHKQGGVPLSPDRVRHYLEVLEHFRDFATALSGGGFQFVPWGARTAANVAGVTTSIENSTRPMPWQMWAPLIAASWKIVNGFSEDIISASKARDALLSGREGPSGKEAVAAIEAWLAAGNRVPLHTGEGHDEGERGTLNLGLLCRIVGCKKSVFTRTETGGYQRAAADLLALQSMEPDRGAHGGLVAPTIRVTYADGTTGTWVAELGLGETEHLVSILRAACYVLLAALTGMRDNEIQELRRGCIVLSDGIRALASIERKDASNPDGDHRIWWAPEPVLRVIEVLERLSPHQTLLFARSDAARSPYDPHRDVPRLVSFVNSDPSERIGRGRGLGLEPIDTSSKTPINQLTLRRSFSVFAATHPGAELGLGIQLGHAALRMTSGYARDSQQLAVQMYDDERTIVARRQVQALMSDSTPMAGAPAGELHTFQGQVIADDKRAESLMDSVAERYHIGTFNDCVFTANRAACGPDGPHLASQHCATARCTNALFLDRHLPTVQAQITGIDEFLDRGNGHPVIVEQLQDDRERLARIVRELKKGGATP